MRPPAGCELSDVVVRRLPNPMPPREKTRLVIASTSILVALAALQAFAGSAAPSNRDAAHLVQAEIEAYRSTQVGWLDGARRADLRAVVQDMLADSATRSSFQDDAAIAGWRSGFHLGSPDGQFLLKVGGQVQVRFVLNRAKKGGPLTLPGQGREAAPVRG